MVDLLNQELYAELYEVDPERYILETTFTFQEGVLTYSLPADFETVNMLGCGLFIYENSQIGDELIFDVDSNGDLSLKETVKGNTTLKLRYLPTRANLTALDDETVVEDRYGEVLLHGLDKMIALRDQDIQRSNNSGQIYSMKVNKMQKRIMNTPSVHSMPDPTNPF
jgi:hypothetical protein